MRSTWDEFFMKLAYEVATRATCDRKHVGCVLVRDKHILATGYNGSIPKMEHCDDAGHMVINGQCLRTTHAEQNALCQAAKFGTSVNGGVAYVTCEPCWTCFKLLLTSGIKRIVYAEPYNSEDSSLKKEKCEIISALNFSYEKMKLT